MTKKAENTKSLWDAMNLNKCVLPSTFAAELSPVDHILYNEFSLGPPIRKYPMCEIWQTCES